jgi:hypothetical protein
MILKNKNISILYYCSKTRCRSMQIICEMIGVSFLDHIKRQWGISRDVLKKWQGEGIRSPVKINSRLIDAI